MDGRRTVDRGMWWKWEGKMDRSGVSKFSSCWNYFRLPRFTQLSSRFADQFRLTQLTHFSASCSDFLLLLNNQIFGGIARFLIACTDFAVS